MKQQLTAFLGAVLFASCAFAQTPNIVGYEYWFDHNDATRIFVPITPTASLSLNDAPLNTTGLSLGQHIACLRLKDMSLGEVRWSSVVCRALNVTQPSPWEIVAVRYWWSNLANPPLDTDMRYKYFNVPQTTLEFMGLLDLCNYPLGAQTLKLQLLDNHGQWSSVVTRSVSVLATGTLGLPQISTSQSTFCTGDTVTFTAMPQTGSGFATPTGYNWQIPSGLGWETLATLDTTVVVIIGSTSEVISAAATNYCGVGSYNSFPVNIPATPDQPDEISGPLQACVGSTVEFNVPQVAGVTYDWVITGGWSGTETGNSISTTIGMDDATITVTPTNSCGIPGPEQSAYIIVTDPPNAGSDGSVAICSNGVALSLFAILDGAPQAGGIWLRNGVVVPSIYDPAIDSSGIYTYVVAGTGPCLSDSSTVTVSESQLPNAGSSTVATLCSNSDPVLMTTLLAGTPDSGGTWSGPSITTGMYDPETMLAGLYTYTVSGTAPCTSATANLNIVVVQAPNAGVGGTLDLCEGAIPFIMFDTLSNNPDPGGSWSDVNGPASVVFTPGTSEEGVYTYTVAGAAPCNSATTLLEINVLDLQLDSVTGPDTVSIAGTYIFNAMPALTDADSVVWTFPNGWSWGSDPDHFDEEAQLIPPEEAGVYILCATAFGGACDGNEACFMISVTTGITADEAGSDRVFIYPNPSAGYFTIMLSEPVISGSLKLTNALGQQISQYSLQRGSKSFVLDLKDHASGLYVAHLTVNGSTVVKTLMVQR